MSLLFHLENDFEYSYLDATNVENIKTIVKSNSISFINENRKTRLKWIKSSWKVIMPDGKEIGILESIKLFFFQLMVFGEPSN